MKQYLALVERVLPLSYGLPREDRTGTGTLSAFGTQSRYDLRDGFPIVTTKKVIFHKVVKELLWFLRGETNISGLGDAKNIWEPWAKDNGDVGPIYGYQWRNWGGTNHDQISEVIEQIKNNPMSRRLIVSAWNVTDIPKMALPPCHVMFQFYVSNGGLSMMMYQRSADIAIGVPFNISSYALLLSLIARECNLEAHEFIHTIGDAHVYLNHVSGLAKQLTRKPYSLPTLVVDDIPLSELKPENIHLKNYVHHESIKFDVSV